jgi:hypothetical protein
MLLEDAGVLAELGDEGFADAARPDRNLEMILGASLRSNERQADGGHAGQRP